jgi:hypothetical protein
VQLGSYLSPWLTMNTRGAVAPSGIRTLAAIVTGGGAARRFRGTRERAGVAAGNTMGMEGQSWRTGR